mmetsp:Transcript_28330/g.88099  ORF Transcript_28330/g.88099 Transcript_28330/m.88099 type:complete len:243 (-) Transcript_28330:339-1067(-)
MRLQWQHALRPLPMPPHVAQPGGLAYRGRVPRLPHSLPRRPQRPSASSPAFRPLPCDLDRLRRRGAAAVAGPVAAPPCIGGRVDVRGRSPAAAPGPLAPLGAARRSPGPLRALGVERVARAAGPGARGPPGRGGIQQPAGGGARQRAGAAVDALRPPPLPRPGRLGPQLRGHARRGACEAAVLLRLRLCLAARAGQARRAGPCRAVARAGPERPPPQLRGGRGRARACAAASPRARGGGVGA